MKHLFAEIYNTEYHNEDGNSFYKNGGKFMQFHYIAQKKPEQSDKQYFTYKYSGSERENRNNIMQRRHTGFLKEG